MTFLNIVVFDHSCGTVIHYENASIPKHNINQDEDEVVEDFLIKQGHHLSNCDWMSNKEDIIFINR